MNANYAFAFLCGLMAGCFIAWVLTRRWRVDRGHSPNRTEVAVDAADAVPDSLVMGDPERPLIQIEAVDSPSPDAPHLSVPTEMIEPLIPLLKPAAKALRLPRGGAKSMRVAFSREATRGLNNGTLEIVEYNAGGLLPI